jgi:hypothetical protein
MVKIKVLSSELTLSNTSGSTVNNATVVRVLHVGGGGSHHLLTITDSSNATIGTMTIAPDVPEYIEKKSSDKIFVDTGTDVLATHVAFR